MPKLAIYQGDSLHHEVDLDRRNLQIGRAEHNDIVLPDVTQAVSRRHAELRYEHGDYVLYDMNSSNGVWVANRREAKVVLEPDEPVTIGPYRLFLRGSAILETHVGPQPADRRQRSVAPLREPAPLRASPPASRWSKPLVFGAFAVVIALVLALSSQRELVSEWIRLGHVSPRPLDAAALPVAPRERLELPQQPIESARSSNPPPTAMQKDGGRTSERAEPDRPNAPEKPEAAEQASQTAARPGPAPPRADPNSGSSEWGRTPGPGRPAPTSSDDPLWAQYEAARNTLQHGSLQEALARFCEIELGYRDVKEAIDKIGNGIRANVPKVLQEAAKLEKAGELDRALDQYDLAVRWNTSLRSCPWAPHNDWTTANTIIESARRVRDRMTVEGEAALQQADADYALGRRPQARVGYERARRYLADDHHRKKEINNRLEEIASNR